jgi:hypothetical protein
VDFADIVNQSEQSPLYIHFAFGTQGESIHVFMYTDVRKDRLDNCQPSRIDFLALLAIDLGFHQIDQVRLTRVHLNRKIPARSVGLAQTARAQATVATAHAIARVVYKMLKYKVEYDPLSVNEYQKQYEEQQVKYMKKKAAKLGFQLIPA